MVSRIWIDNLKNELKTIKSWLCIKGKTINSSELIYGCSIVIAKFKNKDTTVENSDYI